MSLIKADRRRMKRYVTIEGKRSMDIFFNIQCVKRCLRTHFRQTSSIDRMHPQGLLLRDCRTFSYFFPIHPSKAKSIRLEPSIIKFHFWWKKVSNCFFFFFVSPLGQCWQTACLESASLFSLSSHSFQDKCTLSPNHSPNSDTYVQEDQKSIKKSFLRISSS